MKIDPVKKYVVLSTEGIVIWNWQTGSLYLVLEIQTEEDEAVRCWKLWKNGIEILWYKNE